MTDCFALLDEPRRPWLEPDALKKKFLTRSAELHPDRMHQAADSQKQSAQAQYVELNAAYNKLKDSKERLRHLLELERGHPPQQVQEIPPGLMNAFLEITQLCREADSFLAERNKVASPLLKVQLFEAGQQWVTRLTQKQKELQAAEEKLTSELKRLDDVWNVSSRAESLRVLEDLYRLFSYHARWRSQVQERIVQLSF
jgi:hypothetical protein